MANQPWYKESNRLAQENNILKQLMISMAHPPGELPPYVPPDKPSSPWNPGKSPAPSRDKLAGLRITPNTIMIPREPAPAESDDDYGEGDVPGHPDWKLSGGPQLPVFKPMGPVIKGTRRGVLSPEENKITRPLQIQAMNYPAPSELDKWLQLYQRNGGSLRHLDPDMRRLILQRGVMKAEASNNIRRLKDSGHKTDYTGGFRLGDDGKLHPVMGIIKADASNNIRRLNESGHQTVFDPVTGQLKIVKTL